MSHPPAFNNHSLTEIEVFGLSAQHNLADGHSYIEASKHFAPVTASLPALWELAAATKIPAMELTFKNQFARVYDLEGLRRQKLFSICPTASNSIDIVGAWARAKRLRVGLIEPTFDNLAQLLHRRGVDLVSLPEACFHDPTLLENCALERQLDAIFLVNPNNPTGRVVNEAGMKNLIDLCARLDLVLMLDTSFRFCHAHRLDEYALLQASSVSYVILEDTGKLWPTLDTKASLLSYSADIAPLMREIYEELYLCSSNLSLAIISAFIEHTIERGGLGFLHEILRKHHMILQRELVELPVQISNDHRDATMSVVWLNIRETGLTDLEMVQYLATDEISVLPGRYFFWDSHELNGHEFVRVALLKPEEGFRNSVHRLRQALERLCIKPEALCAEF